MELKTKILRWTAGLPVAMLNKKTAMNFGVHPGGRILIRTISRYPKEITTIIDTIEGIVRGNEIAVTSDIKRRLNLRKGQKVEISLAELSKSLGFIKKKLNGKKLASKEVDEIIKDVVENSLSDAEIALFVSAMYERGMSLKETVYLINAILKSGNKLHLKNKFIVDKHSIGGIPGNRTTPIVVAICAAAGLIMPKSSSRAITSAAGTADVIETVAKIEFSVDELKQIIKKTNACMVWGGSLGLVPADSKIIQIETLLKIDPEAQLLASIMSKKLAVESNYILIDIPYGKTAKVSKKKALKLKEKFETLGRYFEKKLKVVLTDGKEPIGNGIGPVLELKDVIKVLDPKQRGPDDLERKSLFLAGQILEMTGKAKRGIGVEYARQMLCQGKAYNKFKEIIYAQGGSFRKFGEAKYQKIIRSKRFGEIKEIDNKRINSLARMAGCPADNLAGLYLYHHVGDKIKRNDILLTIYAESKPRLKEAIKYYKEKLPIKIR